CLADTERACGGQGPREETRCRDKGLHSRPPLVHAMPTSCRVPMCTTKVKTSPTIAFDGTCTVASGAGGRLDLFDNDQTLVYHGRRRSGCAAVFNELDA